MAKTERKAAPAKGRPSSYTPEIGKKICALIADGKSLREIDSLEDMPSKSTILEWLVTGQHAEFSDQYARAREIQLESAADELLEIADTPQLGIIETIKPDGSVEVKKEDMLGHRKLQLDTRKWILARRLPKKYGDKLTQEITGKDGTALIPATPPTRIEFEIVEHTARSDSPGIQAPFEEGKI